MDQAGRGWLAAAGALGVALLAPRSTAACCGVSYGAGQRLAIDESAAATLSLRGIERFGTWSSYGKFAQLPAGNIDREARLELSALVRAHPRLQFGLSSYALTQRKRFGTLSGAGGGVGDVTASTRFELLPLLGAGGPAAVAATFSMTAPTGRGPSGSLDALGADATGAGSWEARPGAVVEKIWPGESFVVASTSIGFHTPERDAAGRDVQRSPRWQGFVAGGSTFGGRGSASLGALLEREAAPIIAGARQAALSRARSALVATTAWQLLERTALVLSGAADAPISGLGRGELVGLSLSLGLRGSFDR
jgi:hypothetical protein